MPTGAGEPPVPSRATGRAARRAGGEAPVLVRPPCAAFIERSHERSDALGPSRGEKCEFGPLILSDLNVVRERNQRLHLHAAPIVHMPFEQIVDTQSMIILTDVQGTILHAVGDDSAAPIFDPRGNVLRVLDYLVFTLGLIGWRPQAS